MPKIYSLAGLPLLALLLACNGETGATDQSSDAAAQSQETAAAEREAEPDAAATADLGMTLAPSFRAVIFADDLGRARHIAVRDNGDVYVALREADGGNGIKALRDTDGDGVADRIEAFGDVTGTGIAVRGDHLYFGTETRIVRFEFQGDELVPSGGMEEVITGFPEQRQHATKSFAFDGAGNIYVNIGAPSNACQRETRTKGSPGLEPCPQLEWQASIWRFDADRAGQTLQEDGTRYATGQRNAVAIEWDPGSDALYFAMHGRDQLSQLWPDYYDEEDNAEKPAEEFHRVREGDDFGWPYTYYDPIENVRRVAPEYGGDGRKTPEEDYPEPIVAFPGHWGPNDLLFYEGDQFPARYRDGAFIAFHGSWNRAPLPQGGYNVVFVPMSAAGDASGDWEVFAEGFPGKDPLQSPRNARFRPMALAEMPDGTLLIGDSMKGRIWRVRHVGG